MKLVEFSYDMYSKDRLLIVYGTAGIGRIVRYCLKQHGITPDYYTDARGDGTFYGVPVIGMDELVELYAEKNPIILLAVGGSSQDVALKLNHTPIDRVYSVYNLLEEVREIGDLIDPAYMRRNNFFFEQECMLNPEQLVLRTLDVIVTERCSLRCKNCSNLMQYYQNPKNLDIDEIHSSLEKLLNVVDKIYELRILGGEPFMNQDFHRLIDWYIDHPKIKKIVIITNTTIFPGGEMLKKLSHPKIQMWLSDYGELSRNLLKWINWCEANHVEYKAPKYEMWQDLGELRKHDYSEDEIKYVYETCTCGKLPNLLNGKIYGCPYSANAINLGALDKEEEEFDTFILDGEEGQKEKLRKFLFGRDYMTSCNYCGGRNGGRGVVKAHEQIDKPLPYERRRS